MTPLNLLFAGRADRWEAYSGPLRAACAARGLDVNVAPDIPAEQTDYIVYAPNGPVQDFSDFPRLRAVLNLWAGVEAVVGNPTLRVPLTRMVDHGLSRGMTEWVVGHTLRYHLGMDDHITRQDGVWSPRVPPLAEDRQVCVLGLGTLGTACARALAALGFAVTGWSRTPREVSGVTCLHGAGGLRLALASAEICILLLPDTPETENTLNAETLALMPHGAFVINPGRGPLIDDAALLNALDTGQIAHATLDVFRTEPLPPEHPFWAHPRVTVTPHIAAETRPETAAEIVAENLMRFETGQTPLYLVDRARGY